MESPASFRKQRGKRGENFFGDHPLIQKARKASGIFPDGQFSQFFSIPNLNKNNKNKK
jgi:hypothetical protein